MRPFSVSAIGTRRFYTSDLPLDDPFGLSPFRRITFRHHFQVMCLSVNLVHLNRCQTSQKLVSTHNYSTKRRSPLQPQQLPSPIIPSTDSCSNRLITMQACDALQCLTNGGGATVDVTTTAKSEEHKKSILDSKLQVDISS